MAVIQTGTNAYTFYFDKNVVNFNEESIDYPILFDTTDNTKFYYIDENDDFIEYTPQMGFSRVITFHNNLDTTYEYSNTFIIASSGPSLLVYIDNNNKVWTVSQGSTIATNIKGFRLENVNLAENQILESINSIVNPYIGTKTSLEPHTNLTNTKWYLSDNLSGVSYNEESFNVNFISNGEAFTTLSKQSYRGYIPLYYGNIAVFNSNGWVNSNYRTIEITGGADVDSAALLTFLNSAGKQIKEISGFQETKTALKIYEDLTQAEYDSLEKEPNAFYLVNGVGMYKGDNLISALQPIVSLNPPSNVKSGSLGLEELNIILHTENPIINLNNEYFVKADIYNFENEIVFSHIGNRDGALYNKTFTLNTQTGNWTLKEVLVQEFIDITEWIRNGIVPEEYRNEKLLKKCVLFETDYEKAYVYSGSSFEINDDIIFSSVGFYNKTLNVAKFSINSDWTVSDIEYIEIESVSSASIIEDQGKIELATYDVDGEIVDINDTPNQFLQRKLNKPSFYGLGTGLENAIFNNKNKIYEGQIVRAVAINDSAWGAYGNSTAFFIIAYTFINDRGHDFTMVPLGYCPFGSEGYVIDVSFDSQSREWVIRYSNNITTINQTTLYVYEFDMYFY